MKLYFYKDGQKVGVSSRAFDVIESKELMRGWTLQFTLDNKNPMRKYVAPSAMFEIDGQLFDISSFHQNSGVSNTTEVTAEHVSYRLNKYIIPPMYSFLGTPAQILADMLDKAVDGNGKKASSEFSVGNCANIGTKAFALGNEQEVSLRSATLGLQAIGVEVSYDNFKIHLPQRIGTETGRTFKFGVDLVSIDRNWTVDDGFTYEISVAALNRLPGAQPWETFSLGDNIQVQDDIIGDIISRRIVCYTKCHDDPSKDSITLGVFVRDSATNAIEMQAEINTKLTEGESYNNVRINRSEGFVSETNDGNKKVTMSGTDGFVCWVKQNGVYKPVASLSDEGLAANKIASYGANLIYGVIGGEVGDTIGFLLKDSSTKLTLFKIVPYLDRSGFALFAYPNGNSNRVLDYTGQSVRLALNNNSVLLANQYETYLFDYSGNTGIRLRDTGLSIGSSNGWRPGYTGDITSGSSLRVVNGIIVGYY